MPVWDAGATGWGLACHATMLAPKCFHYTSSALKRAVSRVKFNTDIHATIGFEICFSKHFEKLFKKLNEKYSQ